MSLESVKNIVMALVAMLELNTGMVIILILFSATVLMNYAALVMLINIKLMEKRKQLSMERVDDVFDDIELFIESKYLSLAKQVIGSDYFNTMEVRLTKYNIAEAINILKDEYRRRVRRNGFENKTSSQWAAYVDACNTEDMAKFTKNIDLNYHPGSVMSRPQWYEYNQSEVIPEVANRVKRLFDELLYIASKNRMRKFFRWRILI